MGVVVEGYVEAVGEEAGFEAGGAEDRLLRERHALEGEQFLGVDGLVDGGEVGCEMGDLLEVFEPDDGEGGGSEAVRAGVAGGAGLAFGGAWTGAFGGVGAIGGELFFGDGHTRASSSSSRDSMGRWATLRFGGLSGGEERDLFCWAGRDRLHGRCKAVTGTDKKCGAGDFG